MAMDNATEGIIALEGHPALIWHRASEYKEDSVRRLQQFQMELAILRAMKEYDAWHSPSQPSS